MRITPTYIILFILTTIVLVCCKHDILSISPVLSKDTVFVVTPPVVTPGGTTSAVSDTVCFNTEVLPLYVSYCASSGCHDVTTHRSGVITTTYSYIMNGIRPKNANGSSFYTIIGNGMPPQSHAQLSSTQVAVIKKWIDQGALNTNCTNVCDTTVYTYSGSIQAILTNNCAGCHGTSPGSSNVYIGTYASAKAYISANKTTFNNAINYSASIAASKRMPPSGKLVDCKLLQIQKWINNGYPQ
ncbi:MAG: hypothetical protein EBV82_10105 [Chitinophagia bacterium]|jgi:uncharacterized membrane protein|nr:hypothetical protein [Chitinophagia bacterium]